MSQDNSNNNGAATSSLSRTLQQSLQDVLMEVSFEGNSLMGAPSSTPRNSLLQSNFGNNNFGNSNNFGGMPSFNMSSGGGAFRSPSLSTSSAGASNINNPYAAFMAQQHRASINTAVTGNSSSASTHSRMRPSEALGMSTEELLLAAATEKRMLEQTQRLAARQHELAEKTLASRRLYNESLLALMKSNNGNSGNGNAFNNCNPAAASSNGAAANNGLLQQGLLQQFARQQQQYNTAGFAAAVPPFQGGSNSKVAIKVLGTSLRKKDSPYLDVSKLQDPDISDKRTRGGVTEPYPEKLHRMLEEVQKSGKDDIISFFSHGRAFAVHDPDRFTSEIMPQYFKQSRLSSFQRQLNLYGFTRITSGPDAGGYYHELFLKGRPSLAIHMRRVGLPKGEDRRKMRAKNMKSEPNFYAMGNVKDAQVNIPGIM